MDRKRLEVGVGELRILLQVNLLERAEHSVACCWRVQIAQKLKQFAVRDRATVILVKDRVREPRNLLLAEQAERADGLHELAKIKFAVGVEGIQHLKQ